MIKTPNIKNKIHQQIYQKQEEEKKQEEKILKKEITT